MSTKEENSLSEIVSTLEWLINEANYHVAIYQAAIEGLRAAIEGLPQEETVDLDARSLVAFTHRTYMSAASATELLRGVANEAHKLHELFAPHDGETEN